MRQQHNISVNTAEEEQIKLLRARGYSVIDILRAGIELLSDSVEEKKDKKSLDE